MDGFSLDALGQFKVRSWNPGCKYAGRFHCADVADKSVLSVGDGKAPPRARRRGAGDVSEHPGDFIRLAGEPASAAANLLIPVSLGLPVHHAVHCGGGAADEHTLDRPRQKFR